MEKLEFKEFIKRIEYGKYDAFRERVIVECKITAPIFINWRKGITEVPELAKPIINQIAHELTGLKVFD